MTTITSDIDAFDFAPGRILSGKYTVVERLGSGWEGEVYLVKEIDTYIERAAKFFFPARNPSGRTVKRYAHKLHKLRTCNALIKYLSKDTLTFRGHTITYLLSDYVDGQTLDAYLKEQFPRGMPFYQAMHLFYAVVKAVEEIHVHKEFHGDIHGDNIIIQKTGLAYDLKLIDVFLRNPKQPAAIQDDVVSLCHLLYQLIGGQKKYRLQPPVIKQICCGLKLSLIRSKFRNATHIRSFLENTDWT